MQEILTERRGSKEVRLLDSFSRSGTRELSALTIAIFIGSPEKIIVVDNDDDDASGA